jgi:hypothetical protein
MMNYNMYLWQNITWLFFHKLSLHQDINKNPHYELFFNAFKIIIPCSMCRNHYVTMLGNPNYNLKKNVNKNNVFNFSVDIHNNVNFRLHKRLWKHEEAKNYYNQYYFTYSNIKRFLMIFVFHNFNKGPEKTNKLFQMILSFSHIFPRQNVRNKLIQYQKKIKPDAKNFSKWFFTYLLLIKSEVK